MICTRRISPNHLPDEIIQRGGGLHSEVEDAQIATDLPVEEGINS